MPWMLFALGAAFFAMLGSAAGWTRETTGGLMLTGGLANTSFVGLPMIEAFYGPAFLGVGILADQLGTYMVLSTLGVAVAALCSPGGGGADALRARGVAGKVLRIPPFQALAAGVLLAPFGLPEAALGVLDRLAGTLVPLALVSVGFQLRLGQARDSLGELSAGLGFKLVLGPALVAALLFGGLGASGNPIGASSTPATSAWNGGKRSTFPATPRARKPSAPPPSGEQNAATATPSVLSTM